MMLPERRVSIMTATLSLRVIFGVWDWERELGLRGVGGVDVSILSWIVWFDDKAEAISVHEVP